MINIISQILIVFTLVTIISCDSERNNPDDILNNFGVISACDTLSIIAEFNECGEWGGHIEKLILTSTRDNNVQARLVIDSISCKEVITKHDCEMTYLSSELDDEKRIIIIDSTKIINKEEERLLSKLIHRVVDLSLLNPFDPMSFSPDSIPVTYSGIAKSIDIKNSKSTIKIHFYNFYCYHNTHFIKTRNKIFKNSNNKS